MVIHTVKHASSLQQCFTELVIWTILQSEQCQLKDVHIYLMLSSGLRHSSLFKFLLTNGSSTEINKYPCHKGYRKLFVLMVILFVFLLALGYMTAAGFYPCLSLPKIINETSPGFLYIYLVELSGIR